MARYPEDCPVFRYLVNRTDYILSPCITDDGHCTQWWFMSDIGHLVFFDSALFTPLTSAARQLLKWSRQ